MEAVPKEQSKILKPGQRGPPVEVAHADRMTLMKDHTFVGQVWIRGSSLKTWVQRTAVLSKGYIYLFEKPKDSEA